MSPGEGDGHSGGGGQVVDVGQVVGGGQVCITGEAEGGG